MKSDKQFLEEIKAAEELEAMGYKKIECEVCKGIGYFQLDTKNITPCFQCEGAGYTKWVKISR